MSSDISTAPSVPKVTPGNKISKTTKTKSTLATNAEEFEKENIRVERDACRMEISKLATEKKDLADTVDILTPRCRLLEDERNKHAIKERLTCLKEKSISVRCVE